MERTGEIFVKRQGFPDADRTGPRSISIAPLIELANEQAVRLVASRCHGNANTPPLVNSVMPKFVKEKMM